MLTAFKPIRQLYDWTLGLAAHKHASWALCGISFAESSFFPIPPDLMLIPMTIANRAKAWWYATICTASSVAGGLAGYAIGYFAFEYIGAPIIAFYGLTEQMAGFQQSYSEHGLLIVLIAGFTPLPYKLITIASGVFSYALLPFTIASIVSRGARFFLVAGLLYFFGQPIRTFIEKHFELLTIAFTLALIGGFVAIKYLI
ncbi:MAG: DedA family protein [Proteobacteria bacterium]|nr:DedA family protein [Pseudomonadota bacterium]